MPKYKIELTKQEPVLFIDPGTTHSGVVIFDGENVLYHNSSFENLGLLYFIKECIANDNPSMMVIEGMACYGMAVGETIFDTVEWIGRFREAFGFDETRKLYRPDIKLFLCGSARAKGANVRRRILDIFPATGGGATPEKGTQKQPGPLYGVSSHALSALAVGLTWFYGQ